mmetsp:Transcript_98778/g.156215  ORF Transcript_98778/g.156215 Transcript_98778/m.156215 type:complete len:481 (-) Transcript_98778:120-1562(-)|eukprot:CAMPEP_0169237192 /NCGR_PEP_ID=MMETSP1016-20121227/29680_1 /TAXON_ID=342587 /ORGANISM="Karlodinium micrum, Strain CCMP2283" /LENGTH=480 /DNA_ID=CAMNT_0009316909 /DNA_START=53 /DNA_END=1495 /DNA_ORIENTATION=-
MSSRRLDLVLSACLLSSAVSTAAEPLFVTDYLPDKFVEAQNASKVDLSDLGWKGSNAMHSGYLTLDKKLGKNTFFWYSASLDGNADAPLLLWLQGGPGASSLFGMFTEIGPFGVEAGGHIVPRNVTWNQHFHLLFFDNPVGTGFSFTESAQGYATNEPQIGSDLYAALSQFFTLFPALRKNDFYVTGESYAGKYVPACAFTVHEKNKRVPASQRINLKGISIGDGGFDTAEQFRGFGDLLWYLGMADESERLEFQRYEGKIQDHLKQGDTVRAFEVFDEMINADFYPYPSYYANVTGMTTNYFNFELAPDATPLGGDFVDWLNKPKVRSRIHVGSRSYAPSNQTVEFYLKADWMRGVVDMLVPLMENYKVIIYNGQNDVILGPALTERVLSNIDWSGKRAYNAAKKMVWRLSSKGPGSKLPDVAGYAREVGSFTQVVVRGAGHMVPGDQPERALDLIERFVAGKSFGLEGAMSANSKIVV